MAEPGSLRRINIGHRRTFTREKPVIFAYRGYPYLIHRLTYNRTNHAGMHVRGFIRRASSKHAVRHHLPQKAAASGLL